MGYFFGGKIFFWGKKQCIKIIFTKIFVFLTKGLYTNIVNNLKMEILYFISGLIVPGIIYGAIMLRKIKITYETLISLNETTQNVSSIRYTEISQKVNELNELIYQIEEKMQQDSYESYSELSSKVKELIQTQENILMTLTNNQNLCDKTNSQFSTEIQQLKHAIKTMRTDPNFIGRY